MSIAPPIDTTNPATVQKFWANVDQTGSCWTWTACRTGGYGQLRASGRTVWAHRFAYELLVGPIPEGQVIDHLCRNRACVNPDHMESVTNAENILRGVGASAANAKKTECPKGHPFSGTNLYVNPDGDRRCRTCMRVDAARYQLTRRRSK